MDNTFSFGDMDQVEASQFDPVPRATYEMMAIGMEMKPTKKEGGHYLDVQFEIRGGDFAGRKVFQNFNLVHPTSQQAVEIALRDVKSWLIAAGLDATGQLTLEKIYALEGRPFLAKVGIEKDATGKYEDKNKIDRFLPTNVAPAHQTSHSPAPPEPTPPPPGKAPWEQ